MKPTVVESPRTLPREMILPVAWDMVVLKADHRQHRLRAADLPAPTTPIRLADGVKLRRENQRGFVQVGQFSQIVNAEGADLLASFAHARQPDTTNAAVRDFVALMCASGVLVPAPEGEASSAELFYFDATEHPSDRLHAPISMEFEITNKCYRKCTYCAYESGPTPLISHEAELSTEEWLALIDEAADLGLFILEFTGGDPFVRSDAFTLMKRASDRGITLLVNSDLSILNDSHVEWLGELPTLHAVQTSLDGATAESCDRTRGPGGFRTLVRQLRRLAEAGLPVSVGATIHTGNYHEVSSIARLAADHGARRLYVGPMYAAGRARALADQVVSADQWAVAMQQYAQALVDGVIEPTDIGWLDLAPTVAGGDMSAVQDQVFLTARGTRGLRIDPRGQAYVTAKLRDVHPRFSSVGSVKDMSLGSVWRDSRRLAELRSVPVSNTYFDGVDVRSVPVDNARPTHFSEFELRHAANL